MATPVVGGGTWTWQNPKPNANSLFAIACPSASVCYAAGEDGPVLKTTDGGATWAQQAGQIGVFALACATTTQCVGVGFAGLAIATSDGGANWSAQTINGGGNLLGVACRTATSCVAVGDSGAIVATSNGGGTWTANPSGVTTNLRAVSCAVNTCYAAGAGGQLDVSTCANCGWVPTGAGTTESLTGIDCLTDTSCVAVGAHGTVVTLYPNSTTWFSAPIDPSIDLLSVDCTSLNECVATSFFGDAYIRHLGAWGPATVGEAGILWSASCPSPGTCFVAGDHGFVGSTTNGGTGWSPKGPPTFNTDFHQSVCVTSISCFAAGNGTMLHTADGGDTWTRQTLPSPGPFLNGISCPSTTTCEAVGQEAAIVRTTDAGATWTIVNPPVIGQNLQGVSCPTTVQCVAVGFSGVVMTSSDGVTWQSRNSGTNVNLWSVSCPTASLCLAVGDINGFSATVIQSTDGGATWTLNSNPFRVPHGIACTDASNCVIVGGFSEILTTTNGGQSWTDHTPSTNYGGFSAVSCVSATACWILGYAEGTFDGTSFTPQPIPPAGQATWNGINCVPNATSTTCLIVGGSSLIARTVDAGATWVTVVTPPADLSGISCPSTTTCVAVGGSVIQSTGNGGATWTGHLYGSATIMRKVSCPTATQCFVAANTGSGVEMLASADGGSTWSATQTTVQQTVAGLSCHDASNCFVALFNGQVMRTTDGGASWPVVAQASSTGATGISCPLATKCFLTGASSPGHVYVSSDSGVTWTVAFDISTDAQAGSSEAFQSIACATSTVCSAGGMAGLIASTTDGINWRTDGPFDPFDVFDISCPSADTCYAATRGPGIMRSTDFGADWQTQFGGSLPLAAGGGATGSFSAISCPTTQACFAAGAGGNVAGTANGGAAWVSVQPSGVDLHIRGISCTSTIDCYATANDPGLDPGGIVVTHDGGATWTLRRLNQSDTIDGISCPAAITCYAVGWPGAIYKTTDGAASVVYEQNPVSGADETLRGISCPSTSTCFAVGTQGIILTTIDSGSTWQMMTSNTTAFLISISCANTTTCVAVGATGLSDSLSGGVWQTHQTPVSKSLTGVSCPSSSKCYAVGIAGTVLVTTNQGVSWTLQSSGVPSSANLLAITCPQTSACVAVGGFGTVIATEDGTSWTPIPLETANTLRAVAYVNPAHGWVAGEGGGILANTNFLNYCLNTGVSSSVQSPQPSGTSVTLSASSAGCINPTYQFEMLAPGSQTWQVVQPYSASGTFVWNTAGLAQGTYKFIVKSRDANSAGLAGSGAGSWDAYTSMFFTLTTQPCTGVAASSAPPGTAVAGAGVTISGAATGCSNPRYQFEMLAPGSQTWNVVQQYSTSPSFSWSTTGAAQGTYHFIIKARDLSSAGLAGSSTGSWDVYATLSYTLTGNVCTSVSAQTSPNGTALSGSQVTITASASGCPNPRYQFELFFPGPNIWKVVQTYSVSNTFSWNTSGESAGSYKFIVKARDASSTGAAGSGPGAWDVYTLVNYTLTSQPCTSVMATTSGSPTVTITGSALGCGSIPLYQFEMQAPGSSAWVVVQQYAQNATFSWNTTGLAKGTYRFIVKARDSSSGGTAGSSNSNGAWDAYTLVTYTVS